MTKEECIADLKSINATGMECIDYAIKALEQQPSDKEKLEKVERIVNDWNNDASHSFEDMCKINEILKE